MMKVEKIRKKGQVLIRARGTLDLFSEDIKVEMEGPIGAWWGITLIGPGSRSPSPDVLSDLKNEVRDLLYTKPARGLHAGGRDTFTERVKIYCANIYCLCEYWLEQPREEWPAPIKQAVTWLETAPLKRTEEMKNIIGEELKLITTYTQRLQKPYPAILTVLFAEKYYQKERREHGFTKWTDYFESFRRTFIANNRHIRPNKKRHPPDFYRENYDKYINGNYWLERISKKNLV